MNIEKFTGPGSTPSRRRFWDNITQAVIASQKVPGRNVSVDEHPGKGTVINVERQPGEPGPCNPPFEACLPAIYCESITSSQSKYGFRNITGDCISDFGGLYYTDVSYSCSTCSRTLGTGDTMLRFYLQADGLITECTAGHFATGGGCFGHHTGGGDCGCGGSGTISYTLLSSPTGGTVIDPAIGAGNADITFCAGSITTHQSGTHTYTCADFSLGGLFNSSLSDCGNEISLSTEYTTAELIADTIAALPDYSGDFELGTCTSHRSLLDDESGLLITRVKYLFAWLDPMPGTCTVRWRERTLDADGVCLFDVLKSEVIPAGATQSGVHEIIEPAANGSVEVVGDCCMYDGTCQVLDHAHCEIGKDGFEGCWLYPCAGECDSTPCAT